MLEFTQHFLGSLILVLISFILIGTGGSMLFRKPETWAEIAHRGERIIGGAILFAVGNLVIALWVLSDRLS